MRGSFASLRMTAKSQMTAKIRDRAAARLAKEKFNQTAVVNDAFDSYAGSDGLVENDVAGVFEPPQIGTPG
jgi:hypothetical protein